MYTASRNTLIAAIQAARRFADDKSTDIYVRTCRLISDGETLRIATSNHETFYEAPIAATCHAAASVSICVNIKDVLRVLRSFKGACIEISDQDASPPMTYVGLNVSA